MQHPPAQTDLAAIRIRACIDGGAVTAGYMADRNAVLKMLNDSLATELVCVPRYRRHHFMARGIHAQSVAQEFLVHSNEEQRHADQIAARIVQLGGEPDFAPDGLSSRSHSEYIAGESLAGMTKENLVAERIAIDSYREFIQYLGDEDPTTRPRHDHHHWSLTNQCIKEQDYGTYGYGQQWTVRAGPENLRQ